MCKNEVDRLTNSEDPEKTAHSLKLMKTYYGGHIWICTGKKNHEMGILAKGPLKGWGIEDPKLALQTV